MYLVSTDTRACIPLQNLCVEYRHQSGCPLHVESAVLYGIILGVLHALRVHTLAIIVSHHILIM